MNKNELPAPANSYSRQLRPIFGPFLLYLLPLPLLLAMLIALLRGNFTHFTTALAAQALYVLAALLIRRGVKRELELQRLTWTRIPRRPWKTAASLCAGLATALCSFFIVDHSLAMSASIGLITGAGMLLAYGMDPLATLRKTPAPLAARDQEVAEALEEARIKVAAIDSARLEIHNTELRRRLRRITAKAVDILTLIADDPNTLRRARRFLKVYLDGAQKVTLGYAQSHQEYRSAELEDNFRNVLITIEDSFDEQHRKLLEKDLLDLDVQIEVLSTQLKQEGVV